MICISVCKWGSISFLLFLEKEISIFVQYFNMKINTGLLLTVAFLFIACFSYADIDSLRREFYNSDSVETRREIAYRIVKKTLGSDTDTSFKYLLLGIKDSLVNPNSERLGNLYRAMAVYYFYQSNFDSVLYYSYRSQNVFLNNGKPVGVVLSQKNIALAERSLGNYSKSLKSFFEILDFYKSDSNYVQTASTLNDIGNTYAYLKNYHKCIEYQHEALNYLGNSQPNNLKGNIYNSIGYSFVALGLSDSAVFYYEKSLAFKLKGGNAYSIANTRNNLCSQIDYKNDPGKCEECFQALLNDQKKINDTQGMARTFINMSESDSYHGNCTRALKRLDSASYYLAFSDDIYLKQKLLRIHAKILNKCGKHKLAYIYMDSLRLLNDSIFELQKQKEILELDTKYQTRQKEESIKMLEATNANSMLKVQKQRWQISFLIFFLITFVGGGILAFFLLKQRQRKLKELAILKMREEERVRIARDMHDEIGSGLTRISFMSEQIKLKEALDKKNDNIKKVIAQSRELSKNLREIIWAIDPRNDLLSELLFYFRDYINEFSDNTFIDCKINFIEDFDDFEVASELRRNLFLALKEILNNIAKYANADKVEINFDLKNHIANLIVMDNGCGFEIGKVKKGLGMESIRLRVENMGGTCKFESTINKGTVVSLLNLHLNTTKM